jgi:membrane-bound lytic murein transglycosylase B
MNSNQHKNLLLGMNHGTATHRLRKAIIFDFVQQAGRDTCYQCGKQISFIDELSIEHIQPWQKAANPKEAFFDLKNIAFSHLKCNVAAKDSNPKGHPQNLLTRAKSARLSIEKVRRIKDLLKEGYDSYDRIAQMYKVHRSTIYAIAIGKTWTDL